MSNLTVDAEALFSTAEVIASYCAKQRETINVYYAQILALESEWQDDKTFGSIVEEITKLRNQTLTIIDEIYNTYPKYFRQRAQMILERPIMNGGGTSTVRVVEEIRVPHIDTPYYSSYTPHHANSSFNGDAFRATPHTTSNSHGYSSKGYYADRGFIRDTFNVSGCTPTLMSELQTSFAKAPQNLVEGVYRTTTHLAFAESKSGSYYAPCGIRSEAQKSTIVVDYHSSTLQNDLVSLVGQHLFYWADDEDYYNMLDSLKEEGNNVALQDDLKYRAYLDTFKKGVYIPDEQNDDKLSSKKYSTAARFFTECFIAYATQDEETLADLQKYFGKSYDNFLAILNKESDALTY